MNSQHVVARTASHQEPHREINTRLHGGWLWLARAVLLTISTLYLIVYIVGIPIYFAQIFPSHHNCIEDCLSPADIQSLHALGISIMAYAVYWTAINLLFVLVYFAVAALIFWRKSDDWMALLASFSLIAFGASFPSIPFVLAVQPGWSLPVTLLGEDILGFPSLIIFLLLFPTGRFVPRWTLWVTIGSAVIFVFTAFFPDTISHGPRQLVIVLVALVVFGSLVYAQIYRYRHVSTPVERQQTKWIVFGAAIALLGFLSLGVILTAAIRLFTGSQNLSLSLLPQTIVITSIFLLLLLIPLSLAFALLRYRLWDVDVLINKALVYSLLTGTLVAVYAGGILGLQALLHGIINQDNSIAIVISTLAIAVIFQPLRYHLQKLIDRRFYRSKYDAATIIDNFGAALRHEVDRDALCEQLLIVVQQTMQPTHLSLWLHSAEAPRKEVKATPRPQSP